MDTMMDRREHHKRVWWQGRKNGYFFEGWSKYPFTTFPPCPISFFSKLKTKTDSFIWYYLFWWRHKYVSFCCALLPEIWYCLPEKTGRTSEDINWQQNNPFRIFSAWILMMREKSYSECFARTSRKLSKGYI